MTRLVCLKNELIKENLLSVSGKVASSRDLNTRVDFDNLAHIQTCIAKKKQQPGIVLLQATLRLRAAGVRSVEEPEGPPSPSLPAPRACYQVECMKRVAVWLVAALVRGEGGKGCVQGNLLQGAGNGA